MPSVINSDDGVVSGTSGLKTTGGNDGILALQNNGTTNVTVTAAGNVGIGTSSPSGSANYKSLTISGTSGAEIFLNAGATNYGYMYVDNGGFRIINPQSGAASGTLQFYTANTERARITSGGDFQFNSGYGSVATAYGCRAWVNFNGTGTVAIRASGNVSSITDSGAGDYTVNFTNAMPDANYCTNATGTHDSGSYVAWGTVSNDNPPLTSNVNVDFLNNSGILTDVSFAQVSSFR